MYNQVAKNEKFGNSPPCDDLAMFKNLSCTMISENSWFERGILKYTTPHENREKEIIRELRTLRKGDKASKNINITKLCCFGLLRQYRSREMNRLFKAH